VQLVEIWDWKNWSQRCYHFTVERPKFFKDLKGKLKLLQRRASRKQKGSKNWEKAQIKVARLHHKITKTRKDFHWKTAHILCDQAETIFAEDLNTVGLNRGMLRKECVDASFGQFLDLQRVGLRSAGLLLPKSRPSRNQSNLPGVCRNRTKTSQRKRADLPGMRLQNSQRSCRSSSGEIARIGISTQGRWGTETAC